MVIAGCVPDGRQLWHRARQEVRSYKKTFGVEIPLGVLAERIALYMHSYTLYWSVRPFGATCILGGLQIDADTGEKTFKGMLCPISIIDLCEARHSLLWSKI